MANRAIIVQIMSLVNEGSNRFISKYSYYFVNQLLMLNVKKRDVKWGYVPDNQPLTPLY